MINRNRTTAVDGIGALGPPPAHTDAPVPRLPLRRLLRAVLELARSHRRLRHWPTRAQVRDLARWNGRDPSSYLLDAAVNVVPELPFGLECELGRHALCFTASDRGRRRELVAFPGGGGFDLMSGLE